MMLRKIIHIDEDKCIGCGACATACHEGAIGMVDGKAKLLREDYCDGLGDCLPSCPTNAITFEEREAPAYDQAAVEKAKQAASQPMPCGCPGAHAKKITHPAACEEETSIRQKPVSRLEQWPVQIKLLPLSAPYFDGADLLIAADCTAYAYAGFHEQFMKNKITLVGCPKLDNVDYSEKLAEILRGNDIRSLTIVRMEVPCCGGMVNAVKKALIASGKMIPWRVIVISTDGHIISE